MEEAGAEDNDNSTIEKHDYFIDSFFDQYEPWTFRQFKWNPFRQRFPFSDHLSLLSPPILAVLNNDVGALERLFQNGLSTYIKFNGNKLLAFAAIEEKTDVFLHLLQRDDIDWDSQNFQGLTTLAIVLKNQNYDYAKYLINAGANVNLKSRDTNSPLHYAIHNLEMTKILLDKGADVNAVNELNETPLYCACYAGKSDIALELICNGADTSIRSLGGMTAFDVAISQSKCKELIDFLFRTSFHTSTCTLINIIKASKTEYFDIITHKFTCDEYSFHEFLEFGQYLKDANINEFETLLNTNPDIIIHLFSRWDDMLYTLCCEIVRDNNVEKRQSIITKLEMLFSKTEVICEIMETYQQERALVCCLAAEGLIDLNELTKLSCLFMMHGIQVYVKDLNTIYRFYGYCELFEIMLHMDIVDQNPDIKKSLITVLMSNMNYDMDVCLQKPDEFIFETNIDGLVQHFALPKFKEHCLKIGNSTQIERVKNLPTIPSLVELSRNAARKYIKEKFNVKTTDCFSSPVPQAGFGNFEHISKFDKFKYLYSDWLLGVFNDNLMNTTRKTTSCSRKFYTILNSLPIPKCLKNIIAFKSPLYNV